MNHREQLRPLDFDEQRALEDLQKLHRDIQRVRGEREQAEAEFETFVGGFQSDDSSAAPPVVAREPRRDGPTVAREVGREAAPVDIAASPETGVPVAPPVSVAPPPPLPPSPLEETPPRVEAAPPAAPSAVAEKKPSAAPSLARRVHPAVGVAIAALLVVGVLFAVFGGRDPEPVRDAPAGAVAPPPVPQPQPQPPESGQSPPATPQGGVNVEMITIRPVWVRVTVDGRRAIERELPAGERIPLHAEHTILIRAGDAGAIAVRRGTGAETRLGENGIVATRTFTAERRGEGTTGR